MDLSEAKHLPKTDYTPAVLDESSKLLLKAADLIERHGLAKHRLCSGNSFCVRGAMLAAAGATFVDSTLVGWNEWFKPEFMDADSRLQKALGTTPPAWNNAQERTQAEVVAKLRAVALS